MTRATNRRICLMAIAVLLIVISGMAYKFIVAGSTQKAEDGRVAVVLEPGERTLMLREMRGFVAGLQQIADAIARDDMAEVAKASRALGAGKADDVPAAMLGKLPLEFKTLAFGTHRAFDRIAADAEANGTAKHALTQVSEVLQKCVACHATYQVNSAAGR